MKMWHLLCLSLVLATAFFACSPGTDTTEPEAAPENTSDAAPIEPAPADAAAPAEEAAPVEVTEVPAADAVPVATEPAAADAAPVATEPVADAAAAPVDAAAAPAGDATGLEGSTWKLGEYTIAFKDGGVLHASGGKIDDISKEGIDGSYTFKDGAIEINVLMQTKSGTWDGTSLVIDGKAAEKVS